MYVKFRSVNLKGTDHMQDVGVDGIILKWILKEQGMRVWITFTWFRIRKSGGPL